MPTLLQILFSILLSLAQAHATTFGPIPVVMQAQNSQYFVRARVVSSSWTRMEPNLHLPYTYWKIAITGQQLGASLGNEATVRQPGGEIGETGYHMAGTATFADGEDVFLPLHDTEEPDRSIKELVGLASGKYRVEAGKDGKKIVVSGLGIAITGSDGKFFSPEEFDGLLQRISRNEVTEEDKNVYVTRNPMHEQETASSTEEAREQATHALQQRQPASSEAEKTDLSAGQKKPGNPGTTKANPVQQIPPVTEESSTGSSVGFLAVTALIVLGLLIGLLLFFRR